MKKNFLFSDYTIGFVLTLLVLAAFYFQSSFFESTELRFYDMRVRLRQKAVQKGDEVVIIAIDDYSIENIGRWPWPRSRMADLLTQLAQYQPKVIGLNLLFSEPENNGVEEIKNLETVYGTLLMQKKIREPKDYSFLNDLSSAAIRLDNDTKLSDTIEASNNVLLAMSFEMGASAGAQPSDEEIHPALAMSSVTVENPDAERAFPPEEAAEILGLPLEDFAVRSLGSGHVNVEPGILRHELPFLKYAGKYYPSMALQLVRGYLGLTCQDIKVRLGDKIEIGNAFAPLDSQNRVNISYVNGFNYVSFFDVINQKVNPAAFKNKIVLVAFTATGLGTLYVTPVSNTMPGAEYIANVVQNILHKNFIVRPPWSFWVEFGSVLLVGLFITLLLPRLKAGIGFAASFGLAVLLIAPATYIFVKDGYWVKIFYSFFLLALGYIVIISKNFFVTEKKKELVEADEIETNMQLGFSCQGQGQLDLAFEKFRKCPVTDSMKDTLYNLALDFERKRQFNKAVAVYEFIGKTDPKFKDIQTKIELLKKAADGAIFGGSLASKTSKEGTVMLDSAAMKPTLGRYELIKELGRGAMGVVYLGKDPKINRTVAIKTMMFDDDIDEKSLKEMKERFFREAESAGNLSHPNIVRIFDAGEDQEMAYIAMELMEGDDLKKWAAKENLLPVPKVLDYISKVADALDFAHQQGVFHRDIKPANIMLLKDGTVRVADFGIARIQGSSKTATGTVLGTPSYMSPEQIAGKKIDGRSDIFSLGVTLYELLTGEKPFKGGDAIGTLLFQIANDPHPDPLSVRPDLPPCTAEIIGKALVKDPDQRYQRGAEMGLDLKNCLAKINQAESAERKAGV